MNDISKPTQENVSQPPKQTVSEGTLEMHDKDEFGDKPYPYCGIYAFSQTMTSGQLLEVFKKGLDAYFEAIKKAGAEPDYDEIEWWDPKTDDEIHIDPQTPTEGISPLSHDNSIARAIRKHKTPRSRRHMDGSDRYRVPSPKGKILARIRRTSRHQPKPEVDEAFSFITTNVGKSITETDIQNVNDRILLMDTIEILTAMAFGGWEKCKDGITNGQYIVEGDVYDTAGGAVCYNGAPLKLDWDWLYTTRQLLRSYNSAQNNKSVKNGQPK